MTSGMATEAKLIDAAVTDSAPHYERYGWLHWPEHPWVSYQFRRALGETQQGGGAISECLQAAARMVPSDRESSHAEWLAVAERNRTRDDTAEAAGRLQTARNCWLRAANYYRHAEFWLDGLDARRLPTLELMETCSKSFLRTLLVPGEAVDITYEPGVPLCAYFVRAPFAVPRQPVLICMGGFDSNAALLQMSLQLIVAFLAMLFFDLRRTSNARQPAIIEDAASYSIAKDPA